MFSDGHGLLRIVEKCYQVAWFTNNFTLSRKWLSIFLFVFLSSWFLQCPFQVFEPSFSCSFCDFYWSRIILPWFSTGMESKHFLSNRNYISCFWSYIFFIVAGEMRWGWPSRDSHNGVHITGKPKKIHYY